MALVTTMDNYRQTLYFCLSVDHSHLKIVPVDDDTTGIKSPKAQVEKRTAIYNLAGQQVDASYKGLVIKNGQKMIQK